MAGSGWSAPAAARVFRRCSRRCDGRTPFALADTLAGLPRGIAVGYVETLEDVDDLDAYRRLNPRRGF